MHFNHLTRLLENDQAPWITPLDSYAVVHCRVVSCFVYRLDTSRICLLRSISKCQWSPSGTRGTRLKPKQCLCSQQLFSPSWPCQRCRHLRMPPAPDRPSRATITLCRSTPGRPRAGKMKEREGERERRGDAKRWREGNEDCVCLNTLVELHPPGDCGCSG